MGSITVCFLAFGLSGCGGPTAPVLDAKTQSETITTPLKIVETRWGPRELYDPGQDPEFMETVTDIYNRGDVTFGDLKIHNMLHRDVQLPADVTFVRNALISQRLDMARAGCKTSYHYSYRSNPEEKGFVRPCGDSVFGSPRLSVCEKKNWRAIVNTAELIQVRINDKDLHKYRLSAAKQISPDRGENGEILAYSEFWIYKEDFKNPIVGMAFIGPQSGYTLEETLDMLTVSNCKEWHRDNWQEP